MRKIIGAILFVCGFSILYKCFDLFLLAEINSTTIGESPFAFLLLFGALPLIGIAIMILGILYFFGKENLILEKTTKNRRRRDER
jgi:hypothetical protein